MEHKCNKAADRVILYQLKVWLLLCSVHSHDIQSLTRSFLPTPITNLKRAYMLTGVTHISSRTQTSDVSGILKTFLIFPLAVKIKKKRGSIDKDIEIDNIHNYGANYNNMKK